MPTKCFWLEPTGRAKQSCSTWCTQCEQLTEVEMGEIEYDETSMEPRFDWDNAPWPAQCVHCGASFGGEDSVAHRSARRGPIYRRADDGSLVTLRDAPVGAMWDATWYGEGLKGDDGRTIVVRLPGNHDWCPDGHASNCTRKGEPHRCWCRHGEPPNLTVDKNCDTCEAGGGSIWVDMPNGWHGHLQNGELVP